MNSGLAAFAMALGALGCGCGAETRGLVLGEADSGLEPLDASLIDGELDAGCATCDASIVLNGATATTQYGGDGGNAYIDTCPGNQAVIGYQGFVTTFDAGDTLVGTIQTVCGTLTLGGSEMNQILTTPGATLSARGDSPDTAWTQMCPPNQLVVGFQGHSGQFLDRVAFTCAHWTATDTPNGVVFAPDVIDTAAPEGGDGGTAFQESCPAGQMARGSSIRAGFWIDAFALICATPAL